MTEIKHSIELKKRHCLSAQQRRQALHPSSKKQKRILEATGQSASLQASQEIMDQVLTINLLQVSQRLTYLTAFCDEMATSVNVWGKSTSTFPRLLASSPKAP